MPPFSSAAAMHLRGDLGKVLRVVDDAAHRVGGGVVDEALVDGPLVHAALRLIDRAPVEAAVFRFAVGRSRGQPRLLRGRQAVGGRIGDERIDGHLQRVELRDDVVVVLAEVGGVLPHHRRGGVAARTAGERDQCEGQEPHRSSFFRLIIAHLGPVAGCRPSHAQCTILAQRLAGARRRGRALRAPAREGPPRSRRCAGSQPGGGSAGVEPPVSFGRGCALDPGLLRFRCFATMPVEGCAPAAAVMVTGV